MSNTREAIDDEDYIRRKLHSIGIDNPSENEIERFCERVSIAIIDGCVPERIARETTFRGMYE